MTYLIISCRQQILQMAQCRIKGTVVLSTKKLLDSKNFVASLVNGTRVSLQLIGTANGYCEANGSLEMLNSTCPPLRVRDETVPLPVGDEAFNVTFDWNEKYNGVPGAFKIKNHHDNEFYLKTLTLEDVPGKGRILFVCYSWVYPAKCYNNDRVFFTNKTYLPSDTPMPLRYYREHELRNLRGDGKAPLKEWDRVYDYAYYNNLGHTDKDQGYVRKILGGSDLPYPRRARTGLPPTESDPDRESRLPIQKSFDIYVPRDERFGHLKMSEFFAYALKSIFQYLKSSLEAISGTPNEFDSFKDVMELYDGGLDLVTNIDSVLLETIKKYVPSEFLKEILRSDGEKFFEFPMPQVIKEDESAWRSDEEFAREMLAGVNPVMIRHLEKFPPASKLDEKIYGHQSSNIREQHVEHNLDGLTVDEAIKKNKLFILDHHDILMPYLGRINTTTSTKTYATRTILFLKPDGTLRPLAIELSLPHRDGDRFGAVSKVFTPSKQGVENAIWQLAKAYVTVNDSGYHQLISHWLNTHAVIEPFIIATNRQLSVMHPIYKLLHPHFRDTIYINAVGRQILINAGGLLELTVYPGKYAMEMSSKVYKNWEFPQQALPEDLKKRGMAVDDPTSPHGLRLLIEDYPFAVDGLEIWSAIKKWVEDYCFFYYNSDKKVQQDTELQSWWKEVREEGHGDKKDEPWWPKMQTRKELIDSCTIIIWVASALHAALNFGQYPYAGYLPNRPTLSRRFMPEQGTPEYKDLESDPDKAFLKTITSQLQTVVGISVVEILSRHSTDEVYLGQRDISEWTSDQEPLNAFKEFGNRLAKIEEKILAKNKDPKLKNRVGPVNMPYTLLYPSSKVGLTGKGIPNSVSI